MGHLTTVTEKCEIPPVKLHVAHKSERCKQDRLLLSMDAGPLIEIQKRSCSEKKCVTPRRTDSYSDTYMGISREDPVWNRPSMAHCRSNFPTKKLIEANLLPEGYCDDADEYDDHVCNIAGCNHDHSIDSHIHSRIHGQLHTNGCTGGLQTDTGCECCKGRNGHTIAAMMRSEDCKRCTSQMSGLPVNPKYPQLRQRMLKTLNQRRDISDEIDVNGTILRVPKTSSNCSVRSGIKNLGKKETIVVNTSGPFTEDVDVLVSMIEGTQVSSDPKKAAKRARQKEKKRIEDELRIKEEAKKAKEEQLKREAELKLAEERKREEEEKRELLLNSSKKSKKKKKKKVVAVDTTKDVPLNIIPASNPEKNRANPNPSNSLPSEPVKGKNINKKVSTTGASEHIIEKPYGKKEKAQVLRKVSIPEGVDSSKKSEMVTIRRHPTVPDTTVTISVKSHSGEEDVLYTLINGQVYRTDSPMAEQASDENALETKPTAGNGSKKKKKKSKRSNSGEIHGDAFSKSVADRLTQPAKIPTNVEPMLKGESKKIPLNNGEGKSFPFFNGIEGDVEIDLTKLKLPPGITITKVNQNMMSGVSVGNGENGKDGLDHSSSGTIGPCMVNSKSSNSYGDGYQANPSVIVVDANFSQNNISDEDYFGRVDNEEFEEVVSSKTRRLRNRAQKSKEVDDVDDNDRFMSETGLPESKLGEFNYTGYQQHPRPKYNYVKGLDSFPSKRSVVGKVSSIESKVKFPQAGLPKVTSTGEKHQQPQQSVRMFRSRESVSSEINHRTEDGLNSNNPTRSRYSRGTANVIPRLAKVRSQFQTNGNHVSVTAALSGHNGVSGTVRQEVDYNTNEPYKVTVSEIPQASQGSRKDLRKISAPHIIDDNTEDSMPFVLNSSSPSNMKSRNVATTSPSEYPWSNGGNHKSTTGPIPQVLKGWNAREATCLTLGPFTVQAEDRTTTWSPWGERSGTECSSPDNPSEHAVDVLSRPHSCDSSATEIGGDPTVVYPFWEIPSYASRESPIQRPTPIPLNIQTDKEVSQQGGVTNTLRQSQLLVNPICRPSSRTSRPNSILSDRSSVEDVVGGRVPPTTHSPTHVVQKSQIGTCELIRSKGIQEIVEETPYNFQRKRNLFMNGSSSQPAVNVPSNPPPEPCYPGGKCTHEFRDGTERELSSVPVATESIRLPFFGEHGLLGFQEQQVPLPSGSLPGQPHSYEWINQHRESYERPVFPNGGLASLSPFLHDFPHPYGGPRSQQVMPVGGRGNYKVNSAERSESFTSFANPAMTVRSGFTPQFPISPGVQFGNPAGVIGSNFQCNQISTNNRLHSTLASKFRSAEGGQFVFEKENAGINANRMQYKGVYPPVDTMLSPSMSNIQNGIGIAGSDNSTSTNLSVEGPGSIFWSNSMKYDQHT